MSDTDVFVLPSQIISPADVSRLWRELQSIEDFLDQARIRQGGQPVQLPVMSHKLEQLCEANNINVLHEEHREYLKQCVRQLKDHAPSAHISFASPASPAVVQQLVVWLREQVDPLLLVRIGLSPAIVAGCVVRTSNKQFDFSLQRRLQEKKQLLVEAIQAIGEATK